MDLLEVQPFHPDISAQQHTQGEKNEARRDTALVCNMLSDH